MSGTKSLLARLFKTFAPHVRTSLKVRTANLFRPALEQCEARDVPAGVYTWAGMASSDAGNPSNWSVVGEPPGQLPDGGVRGDYLGVKRRETVRILIALILASVSLGSLHAEEPKPKPRKVLLPARNDFYPHAFHGRVVSLTDETITIQPEGDFRIGEITFLPDGTVVERLYFQDNSQPAKTFTFSDDMLATNDTLPADRKDKGQKSPRVRQHKISDILVGDIVRINCWKRQGGGETCLSIQIQRRPRGKVPPALGDNDVSAESRVDIQHNAEQFLEETLIPAYRDLKLFPAR
jgi:hypothetical protein